MNKTKIKSRKELWITSFLFGKPINMLHVEYVC